MPSLSLSGSALYAGSVGGLSTSLASLYAWANTLPHIALHSSNSYQAPSGGYVKAGRSSPTEAGLVFFQARKMYFVCLSFHQSESFTAKLRNSLKCNTYVATCLSALVTLASSDKLFLGLKVHCNWLHHILASGHSHEF